MKIAVFHHLPSGGAKRALQQFIQQLSKSHTIDEYTMDTSVDYLPLKVFVRDSFVYKVPHQKWPRVRPYLLDCIFLLLDRIFTIRALDRISREIAKDIQSRGYDIVHVDLSRVTHAPSILKYIQLPMVYFCHDPKRSILEQRNFESDDLAAKNIFKKIYNIICSYILFLRERVTNNADVRNVAACRYIVTNSYYTREYIHKVYDQMAHVNYLGVDTTLFHKDSLPLEDYILSVGRIYRIKGHDHIIRALGLIPKAKRPRLKIVGDCSSDEEKNYLLHLAKSFNVEVELLELIDDAKLVRLYNQALVTVYVPVMEPFGFVPLEAMACGCPVIAIREGGIRESIKDGETGLLVERDDQELADAIIRVISDSGLRQRLSERSREYVRSQWTWDTASKRLEDHYRKCISLYSQRGAGA